MAYVYTLPSSEAFRGKGLYGYSFGPLAQKDLEVLYIESEKGHDTFMICKGITRLYYVLAGSGHFTISGQEYPICPGVIVEVPAGIEFSYSGRLTMLAFCKRQKSFSNVFTRWNNDVVSAETSWPFGRKPWLTRLIRLRIFGKSPTSAFLRLNKYLWKIIPSSWTTLPPLYRYGSGVHAVARRHNVRAQAFFTAFLRNRPELELVRRLVCAKTSDTVRIAVLGCSTGAEAYSIAWAARSARPDLNIILSAVDISEEAVAFGKRGIYPLKVRTGDKELRDDMAAGRWRVGPPGSALVGAEILDQMTADEKAGLFAIHEDVAVVKDWVKEGIGWHIGDVRAPEILERLGPQDIVVASNFLCHMEAPEAEECLRNIARLVAPQGYLFASGVDLNVRQKIAQELGWRPVLELLEEIHQGDHSMRDLWPCDYAGLEPLNKRRGDWKIRYATAFQLGCEATTISHRDTDSAQNGELQPASHP